MGNRWKLLVALLACGCLLIGCDKDKPEKKAPEKSPEVKKAAVPVTPKPAPTTPGAKDVAMTVWKAMKDGDGETLAANSDCSDEDKAFMKRLTPIMGKLSAFSAAGLKAYGEEVWLAAAKKVGMEHLAKPPEGFRDEDGKTLECKVDGDKATCTVKGLKEPLKLIKKDGVWLAVQDDLAPKEQREQMIPMMTKLAKSAEALMGKIGKEGVTAEKIFAEFGAPE